VSEAVLRVTCEDLATGEKESVELPAGEYLVLTTEPCHVAHTQAFPGKGTHVITIKGRTAR
jgi:translation elongation factor P/translation initiation factor 5A